MIRWQARPLGGTGGRAYEIFNMSSLMDILYDTKYSNKRSIIRPHLPLHYHLDFP